MNGLGKARLNQIISWICQVRTVKILPRDRKLAEDTVTIQFETSVIEDKIDAATCFVAQLFDCIPYFVEIVAEDILFCCGKMIPSGGLKLLDVFLSHVDKERQIR